MLRAGAASRWRLRPARSIRSTNHRSNWHIGAAPRAASMFLSARKSAAKGLSETGGEYMMSAERNANSPKASVCKN